MPQLTIPVPEEGVLKPILGKYPPGKKFVALHPFTSNPGKAIDHAFWRELIVRIREELGLESALIGAEEDTQRAKELSARLEIENTVGKFSLKELAAFLAHCSYALIGLDSGPMHLASALKKPVVGLFTSSNHLRWGPHGTQSYVINGKALSDFTSQLPKITSFLKTVDTR